MLVRLVSLSRFGLSTMLVRPNMRSLINPSTQTETADAL